MILISHRGNINGPQPELENSPEYIEAALNAGYEVEIDVIYQDGWWLGHDEPEYEIEYGFLCRSDLWVHCKNMEAFANLNFIHHGVGGINYFWHQEDDYTLTSTGYIWTYPGKKMIHGSNAIIVKPEINKQDISNFVGVCSDYIANYGD